MYPCHPSHKHSFITNYRHIPCFLSGSTVFNRTRNVHVECFLIIVSEMTG